MIVIIYCYCYSIVYLVDWKAELDINREIYGLEVLRAYPLGVAFESNTQTYASAHRTCKSDHSRSTVDTIEVVNARQ